VIQPLLILAATFLCLLKYHRPLLQFAIDFKALLLFPAVILLSVIWSGNPSISLWYGLQLEVTILIGVVVGLCISAQDAIRGIFYAMAFIVIVSLISGRTGPSAEGPVLIGVTGSKDMMGYVGMTLFAVGLSVAFDPKQPRVARLSTIVFVPLGALVATGVHAAASALGAVALGMMFIGFMTLKPFDPTARLGLSFLALMVGSIALLAILMSGFSSGDVLAALNKDSTLTGRTVLWAWADEYIAAAPILGHGYRSFWLGSDSLTLLSMFGLSDGRAFQFHNTYKEILVDLGWVGLLGFLIGGITFLYYALSEVFAKPSAPSAFFASMLLLLAARTPIETIVLVFYPYTALLYVCGTASIVARSARNRRPGFEPFERALIPSL
jgi:exopolysaccharide production protein ExoQ